MASIKPRGGRIKRRGRAKQGYFARRNGILRFYAFDDSTIGRKINSRQPIPMKKKKRMKY